MTPREVPFLTVRKGINPNSSGHGVLWGAMFFMPASVTGVTLAAILDAELTRALSRFREEQSPPPATPPPAAAPASATAEAPPALGSGGRAAGLVGAVWGFAWAAFAAAWVVFLAQILLLGIGSPALYGLALAAAWPAIPIGCLAARCARRFPLARSTARAALASAILAGAFLLLLSGRVSGVGEVFFLAGWLFCGPFFLALSATGLRLGWPNVRVWVAGLLYVGLGVLVLLPVPPISVRTYNPVGLWFPFWGLGAPALVTMRGLSRFLKERPPGDGPRA